MSEKEYIVTLHRNVDYRAFDAEMVSTIGTGAVPNRSASVANPRPGSKRNTHYMLTETEADTLRNDPRVYDVELPPEHRKDIELGLRASQPGNFTKTTEDVGDFVNWGLRRCNEETNPYTGSTVSGDYNYTLDGTGVDIVVHDTGIQANHPEWQDASGVSRLQEIDWYSESGLSGTFPTDFYTDYHGHGTHVGSTIAGKTYGWAKNARIYALKVDGLKGPTDPNSGIPISDCFDVVKEWHNNKPIDPVTGHKRPTIVNMSWGYSSYWSSLSAIEYRGVTYTGTDIDQTGELASKGLIPLLDGSRYKTNVRIASVDADLQEMIDAGIHVVIAAGNNYHKIDVEGGVDYDNNLTGTYITSPTNVYYNRGSSPYDEEAHIVGNVDSTIHSGGSEQKAISSETGPGVSVFAPGTNIMAAASNVNVFSGDGEYPTNTNFRISNISGTSMAAPQVAGVLALYAQIKPSITPAQGVSWINDTAKTNQLYSTGLNNDYADYRSLAGGNNKFLFNKFNSNVQLTLGTTNTVAGAAATYSLSSSTIATDEGNQFIITLTTTNVTDGTVVPYTITGVSSADISNADLIGNFTVSSNTATTTFNVTADATTEGAETFLMTLDGLNVTTSVTINDTSTTPAATPTYAVAPATTNVNEGSELVFNVTTTNVADATTLYWSVTNASDFATPTGSFTVTSNTATFSVTPTADIITEGVETFTASVRTESAAGTIVATSNAVTINDTSTTPVGPTYVSVTSPANANEGDNVTFSVSAANIVDATTVPYTISGVSSADIGGASLTGNITITGNSGSLTVTLTEDATTEGVETITLTLGATDSAGDATGGLSTSTQVADTSTDSFITRTVTVASGTNIYGTGNRYYIAEVAGVSPALSLSEGTTYRFDQSDSSNATHQLLFSTTPNGTHGGGVEYTNGVTKVGTAGQAGAYTEITVAVGAPALHYYCINHGGMGGTANAAAAYTFDATPTAGNVNEGSALTINVATANVADATTLYWTATNAGDFSTASGSFTITSNSGSFTVTPTADATTEGAEVFTVQIRTGSTSGNVVDTSDAITINDTSTTPVFTPDYTISVTHSGNSYNLSGTDRNGAVSGAQPTLAFNSGDKVRFNVNASTSTQHPFYIKTSQSTGTANQVSGADGNGTTQVDWTTATDGTGSYGYQCSIHFGMWNTITIT